jgi:hypothetical protein
MTGAGDLVAMDVAMDMPKFRKQLLFVASHQDELLLEIYVE